MVQGVPATVVLPGRKTELDEASATAHFSPQYQQYQDAQRSLTPKRSGLTTTTIHRRRTPNGFAPDQQPGISIPRFDAPSAIASKTSTPAIDVKMAKRAAETTIRPAAVQLPVTR